MSDQTPSKITVTKNHYQFVYGNGQNIDQTLKENKPTKTMTFNDPNDFIKFLQQESEKTDKNNEEKEEKKEEEKGHYSLEYSEDDYPDPDEYADMMEYYHPYDHDNDYEEDSLINNWNNDFWEKEFGDI